jgi:transcriptional regulator with XRE-family HTH domain
VSDQRAEDRSRGWVGPGRVGGRVNDLAERCGWSMDTISAIERGVRRVDFDDALKLCRALEVPVVILLQGADPDDLRTLGL